MDSSLPLNMKIIEKSKLSGDVYSMWLKCPVDFPGSVSEHIGKFLHIECGESNFLRRPISICQIDGNHLRIAFRVKGSGTRFMASARVGDSLNVLWPCGKGFDISSVCGKSLIIGGGIGVFPLYQLALSLEDCVCTLGFQDENSVLFQKEFSEACPTFVATDDGSCGYRGFAVSLADELFEKYQFKNIFACGPVPMLRKVQELAARKGVSNCQISLEERMACGIGVCMVCVCRTVYGENVPVCTCGPVFNAAEVDLS